MMMRSALFLALSVVVALALADTDAVKRSVEELEAVEAVEAVEQEDRWYYYYGGVSTPKWHGEGADATRCSWFSYYEDDDDDSCVNWTREAEDGWEYIPSAFYGRYRFDGVQRPITRGKGGLLLDTVHTGGNTHGIGLYPMLSGYDQAGNEVRVSMTRGDSSYEAIVCGASANAPDRGLCASIDTDDMDVEGLFELPSSKMSNGWAYYSPDDDDVFSIVSGDSIVTFGYYRRYGPVKVLNDPSELEVVEWGSLVQLKYKRDPFFFVTYTNSTDGSATGMMVDPNYPGLAVMWRVNMAAADAFAFDVTDERLVVVSAGNANCATYLSVLSGARFNEVCFPEAITGGIITDTSNGWLYASGNNAVYGVEDDKIVWSAKTADNTTASEIALRYVSPQLLTICTTGDDCFGVDPRNGREVWRAEGLDSSPVGAVVIYEQYQVVVTQKQSRSVQCWRGEHISDYYYYYYDKPSLSCEFVCEYVEEHYDSYYYYDRRRDIIDAKEQLQSGEDAAEEARSGEEAAAMEENVRVKRKRAKKQAMKARKKSVEKGEGVEAKEQCWFECVD